MTILRYGNVYGPRQNGSSGAGVVAIFAAQMVQDRPVRINGSGKQMRDFIYIKDCAEANRIVIENRTPGAFNLGTGIGTSIADIFDKLCVLAGYHRMAEHGPGCDHEVSRIWLNNNLAREKLGWSPNVDLEEGLQRTLKEIQAQHALQSFV
jgi:UDP-glucose 4-epimerase